MAYEVLFETVAAEPMAAVRDQATQPQLSRVIPAALDKVYAVLRAGDYGPLGCNVVWYGPTPNPGPMPLRIGVRLDAPFPGAAGEVEAFETPAAEVAHVVYLGPYGRMQAAHDACRTEPVRRGRRLTGASWEVYGDWSDDPTQLRTDIYYHLEARTDG